MKTFDLSSYRALSDREIAQLQSQGCTAADWGSVCVSAGFCADTIRCVNFSGKVYIGSNVTLQQVSNICGQGETSFANGDEIGVLKEDGGLEVIMYDGLTSMEATLEVQEPSVKDMLHTQARAYADELKMEGVVIEDGVKVSNVRLLKNVHLGPCTTVEGATRLVEVSVNSLPEAPSYIGDNVILEHVIVCSDSHIGDAAQLDYCFVGQGCHIGRMFSATQSLFFANCHFENGEACALFAGPYSVSHHKATLLIACQISFFNAGSGSNQSNHSYKMGPNKYGQLLRGAKLGSSSYVYWPMQVGAFSTVIGHHTSHADLRMFPFSLLVEGVGGRTIIVPGHALKSVGTRRDVVKWPKRDHRTAGEATRRDLLNFTMLNPYTVGYINEAVAILMKLVDEQTPHEVAGQRQGTLYYEYAGCLIGAEQVQHGLDAYQQAIEMYLSEQLQKRTAQQLPLTSDNVAVGHWCDYGGMIVPQSETLALLQEGITLPQMQGYLADFEWNWVALQFESFYGKKPSDCTPAEIESIIANGAKVTVAWNAVLDADGERDLCACNIEL